MAYKAMKKIIKYTIFLGILLAVLYLGVRSIQKSQQNKVLRLQTVVLPDFEFADLQGKIFRTQDLEARHPVLVIYFNTTCEHCQYEAEEIYKHRQTLEKISLLMISVEDKSVLTAFVQKYRLDEVTRLKILQDTNEHFRQIFGSSSIPNIFIYDADHKLVKHYRGETKMEAILKYLK